MQSLKGKTILITGASRGIGLEIGLAAAREGANVVICAKTDTPHPKLPGTIYTAAEEIERAGGRALAMVVDVRDEASVAKAVQRAVQVFGGIDILVNNASAISLTPTLDTSMKKYDLMHSVNGRGTYVCSQLCLPYLLKSAEQKRNPIILNISPPLDLSPANFQNHVAYSVAKFNMSLFCWGMAHELEGKVGVCCLWPLHAVATAATQMLGSDPLVATSRKPQVMADAALLILKSENTVVSKQFFIDEDVLRYAGGVTEKQLNDEYSMVKGESNLSPDFFVPSPRLLPVLSSKL